MAASLVDVLSRKLLVQQNFHADGCNQISPLSLSLFRVIWKCGWLFSTERISLAIYCAEFLKAEDKLSRVSGFRPALTMLGAGVGRGERGGCKMDLYVFVYTTKVSIADATQINPQSLGIQTCFCLFQQIATGRVSICLQFTTTRSVYLRQSTRIVVT